MDVAGLNGFSIIIELEIRIVHEVLSAGLNSWRFDRSMSRHKCVDPNKHLGFSDNPLATYCMIVRLFEKSIVKIGRAHV